MSRQWVKIRENVLDSWKAIAFGPVVGLARVVTGDDSLKLGYGGDIENFWHKTNQVQGIVGGAAINFFTGGTAAPIMGATRAIWQSSFPKDTNYSPIAEQLNNQQLLNDPTQDEQPQSNLPIIILLILGVFIIIKNASR